MYKTYWLALANGPIYCWKKRTTSVCLENSLRLWLSTCVYQGGRNGSFSENFANVINDWSLSTAFDAWNIRNSFLINWLMSQTGLWNKKISVHQNHLWCCNFITNLKLIVSFSSFIWGCQFILRIQKKIKHGIKDSNKVYV